MPPRPVDARQSHWANGAAHCWFHGWSEPLIEQMVLEAIREEIIVTENQLTKDEFEVLASFDRSTPLPDIDPQHFAKLLSLALVEQQEGGPQLTDAGRDRLAMGFSPLPREADVTNQA